MEANPFHVRDLYSYVYYVQIHWVTVIRQCIDAGRGSRRLVVSTIFDFNMVKVECKTKTLQASIPRNNQTTKENHEVP